MRNPLDMLASFMRVDELHPSDPGDGALTRLLVARRHRFMAETYKRVFESEDGQIVLGDLARFGYMYSTTDVPGDSHASALAEGSRQVVLHIQRYCELDVAALIRMAGATQALEDEATKQEYLR